MNILDSLDDNPFITNFTSSFCYMWDWLYFLHVSAGCMFLNTTFSGIVFSCLFAIIFGGELFINHICLWQEHRPPNFGDVCALSLKWWNLCADWINKVLIYRVGAGTFWLSMLFILSQSPDRWTNSRMAVVVYCIKCCSNKANNQPCRGKRGGQALS